jgi:hypothetical protein
VLYVIYTTFHSQGGAKWWVGGGGGVARVLVCVLLGDYG